LRNVIRARSKGKDEIMVGYVKHNFFVRYRQFDSFVHMNQLAGYEKNNFYNTNADHETCIKNMQVIISRLSIY
jgi:transposase